MRITLLKFFALTLIVALLFPSCATIVSKSKYPLTIHSNPVGAGINVTNKKGKQVFTGVTPSTVELKSGASFFKRAEYTVKLTALGYEEQNIPVKFKVDGWYWGNIFIGGLIGFLIVDPATGAMYKLDTPPINVTLKPSTVSTEPRLEIINFDTLTIEQQQRLVKLN